MNKWIYRKELCHILGICKRTLERNDKEWKLKKFEARMNGRVIRYNREPLIKHLEKVGVL